MPRSKPIASLPLPMSFSFIKGEKVSINSKQKKLCFRKLELLCDRKHDCPKVKDILTKKEENIKNCVSLHAVNLSTDGIYKVGGGGGEVPLSSFIKMCLL